MYDLKGKDNCIGFIASVDSLAQEDEYIIHLLRKAGCVFFVKTNVPQTLMHLETYNNGNVFRHHLCYLAHNNSVYGRTLNPYNRRLSPGGSSGGESALVGFRGSPIGLASDGGGSIRCPAAFMGLYGLKPTSGRIPLNEAKLAMPGYDSTPASAGPVCRSLRDNELFIKVMLDAQPWLVQPGLVPIPWRPVELTNVKIGVSFDDGICRPHPPIKRAIEYVSKRLSGISGISVSEYVPYKHAEGYDLIRRLYYTDGGEMNKKQMATSGEPMLPMSAWIMKSSHTKTATMEDLWAMNVQREKYRSERVPFRILTL
jgi:amidase